MSVTSRRRSDPSGMLAAKLTVMLWPEGAAVPSTFTRLRPSSTVMRVVEPSKVAPSGSCRVTDETSSPDSTVPSQVRRVFIAPMTLEPASSLGLAAAFSVVMAALPVRGGQGHAARRHEHRGKQSRQRVRQTASLARELHLLSIHKLWAGPL